MKILGTIFNRTTDQIVASFTKTITRLDANIARHNALANKKHDKINKLSEMIAHHRVECERSATIRAKLADIIA